MNPKLRKTIRSVQARNDGQKYRDIKRKTKTAPITLPKVYTLKDSLTGRTEETYDPEGVPSWLKGPR